MKRYIYKAENLATFETKHGVIVELFGKSSEGFRIESKHKLVIIETDKILNRKVVNVNNNKLQLIGEEEITPRTVKQGEKVNLRGLVSYAQRKDGDIPHGLFDGGKMNLEFATEFAMKKLGVKLNRFNANKHLESWNSKVHIKNAFSFELEGEVINPELLNQSQVQNICGRKSYGFGWIEIND